MADRYRHSNGRYRIRKRPLILALALVLLAGLGVGATLGLLHTRTEAVQNEFTYGKVSCQVLESFEEENSFYAKRNVRIQNTGNTDAYIRVLLVFNWKDANGNVFVTKPVINRDFQINLALDNGWIVSQNDVGTYFYYKYPVAPGEETQVLIDGLWQAAGVTGPENGKYGLSAEIVADAIQAEPGYAVSDAWDEVTVGADGALMIQGGSSYGNDPIDGE